MDHSDSEVFNIPQLNDTSSSDQNVELLKSMGFLDEREIRQALDIAKNDLNEALTILTSEKGPINLNESNSSKVSDFEMEVSDQVFDNTKFPLECLVSLESNLYTDNWLVSYNKNEWLDRLLKSSIYLTEIDQFQDMDESNNYNRFIKKSLPEYFKKLLESSSVNKWSDKIQQGVHSMVLLCIELIKTKLNSKNADNLDIFLTLLSSIFNPKSEFNKKNLFRLPTISPTVYQNSQHSGWILDYINHFAHMNGFDSLIKLVEKNDINDLSNLALKPLALCIDYLNAQQLKLNLEQPFKLLIHSLSNVESLGHFRNKNCGQLFELIETMKKLSYKLWQDEVSNFNQLHLKIVLSMLKNSSFNSKMNSLKEICKLIDNSKIFSESSALIDEELLGTWLVNEQVLSFAIEGNLDQAQYCDKLKTIVEFLSNRISHDEIKSLWQMQFNKPSTVVDNLYTIISIVASKLDQEQLDDLIGFVRLTWNDSNFKSHNKLVYLLRLIGQESKNSKTHLKILDTLWSLRNENTTIDQDLIQLIYQEHLNVLNTDRVYRDQTKSIYVKKCICLLADQQQEQRQEKLQNQEPTRFKSIYSLKYLFDILNSYKLKSWSSSKSLKDVLDEIVIPEIKTICQNLIDYNTNCQLMNWPVYDDDDKLAFQHEQIIDLHLNLLKFILKEGNLYLRLIRAQEIWDSMMSMSNNESNVKKCYEWFIECIVDLKEQTRNQMFTERIIKLDPGKLTLEGYECYRLYFLYYNQSETKIEIKSSDSTNFLVDDIDLDFVDYLWQLILSNGSNSIVNKAIEFLIQLCYLNLAPNLKRDVYAVNLKFVQTIFEHMNRKDLNGDYDDKQLINLLNCLENFIRIVAENEKCDDCFCHANALKLDRISITVRLEAGDRKDQSLEINNLYSNDLLVNLRHKVALLTHLLPNNFQLYHNSKLLTQSFDSKSLSLLDIVDSSLLICKQVPSTPVKSSECFTILSSSLVPSANCPTTNKTNSSGLFSTNTNCKSYTQIASTTGSQSKKHLPSVIISSNQQSYDTFDKLLNSKNDQIATRTRSILNLIPTNARLIDLFDSMVLLDSQQHSWTQFFCLKSNTLVKVLYNLETLSIRIVNDENFKQNFLNKHSGLNILIDIFDSIVHLNETFSQQLILILIDLVEYVLLEPSEPMIKKSLGCTNSKLIDLLLKLFIRKSISSTTLPTTTTTTITTICTNNSSSNSNPSENDNVKICVKSLSLVYNLINTNQDQIDCFIESALFRTNILNVLIGAKCAQIRQNLVKFFLQLSSLSQTIRLRLIIFIMKNTRAPIWTNSTEHMRSSARDLIAQSSEYFSLLSSLIENMSAQLLAMDHNNELNAQKLLTEQINWFRMFNMSSNNLNLDQILINGHFKLTKAILTNCSTQTKDTYGPQLIDLLIKLFLFQPFFASTTNTTILEQQTLDSGYRLLLELTSLSKCNLCSLKTYLCQFNQENKIAEWNFMPLMKLKSNNQKYIGLKNGGSTCYMNAVLQQLFMIPGTCDYIQTMCTKAAKHSKTNQIDLLYELENVFMHLKKSNQQFFSPESFWKCFRMWNSNQSINIREQQDAFDFFISLTDQIDECIEKELKTEPMFKTIFEGTYSNQFICQDCEHSYDRQEAFLALNLSVRTFSNLEQSMAQFVKDELLTGTNSYFCEKCNHKRSAIKRTCLKKLPNYLCIQLKRFDYDWESNQALKFDDYFEFPLNLNVKPFTYDYLNKTDNSHLDHEFDLCGIIVHSGQANAGHYYSFLKEPFEYSNETTSFIDEQTTSIETSEHVNNGSSKWFKFNDTCIDQVKLDEQFLAEECFGGNFTKNDSYLPSERTRYWNAYMLFYKRKSFDPNPVFKLNDNLDLSKKSENESFDQFRDSISELSNLVRQCDNKAKNFQLENKIRIENLNLLKQNLILNEAYFDLVYYLVKQNLDFATFESIDLAFNFLFFIYFKLDNKLRTNFNLNKWFDLFDKSITNQKPFYIHIIDYFNQSNNLELLKSYLVDNMFETQVRDLITSLIIISMERVHSDHKQTTNLIKNLCSLVTNFILNPNLNAIFKIIYSFICLKEQNVEFLIKQEQLFVQKLITLLVQSNLVQLKDLPILFEIVSVLALKNSNFKSNLFESNLVVKQFIGIFDYANVDQLKYTQELISQCCQNSLNSSILFIKQILSYLNDSCLIQVDSKQIIELLQDIILVKDDNILKCLQTCIHGEENNVGLLDVIRNNLNKDPKKSYNCVKLIVCLANKNDYCKDYLLRNTSTWQWSVCWLKTKMGENNFDSDPFSPNSTSIQSKNVNESKVFQRTKSAQTTLEHAMDLLGSNSLEF